MHTVDTSFLAVMFERSDKSIPIVYEKISRDKPWKIITCSCGVEKDRSRTENDGNV